MADGVEELVGERVSETEKREREREREKEFVVVICRGYDLLAG